MTVMSVRGRRAARKPIIIVMTTGATHLTGMKIITSATIVMAAHLPEKSVIHLTTTVTSAAGTIVTTQLAKTQLTVTNIIVRDPGGVLDRLVKTTTTMSAARAEMIPLAQPSIITSTVTCVVSCHLV